MEAHNVKTELPLIRLNLVSPLLDELDRHRIESQQVLAEFRLTKQKVLQSDMFVPAPTMYAIVEELAAISGDPYFGVRVISGYALESNWIPGPGRPLARLPPCRLLSVSSCYGS